MDALAIQRVSIVKNMNNINETFIVLYKSQLNSHFNYKTLTIASSTLYIKPCNQPITYILSRWYLISACTKAIVYLGHIYTRILTVY